jgi:hypothetical protein
MSARTEQQMSVLHERSIVRVGCYSVCRRFLLRKRHIELNATLLADGRNNLLQFLFKELAMIGRYGEMQVDNSFRVGGLRALHELFLNRRTASLRIAVEFQQSLGQITIVQSFRQDYSRDDILITAGRFQCCHIKSMDAFRGLVKIRDKCHFVYIGEKFLHIRSGFRSIRVAIDKFKQSFEHT